MSWSTMSPKDRRAIVLGALVLLPALGWIWVVRPYRAALEDTRDALAIERLALSREKAAVAVGGADPTSQRAIDSSLALAVPRLFEGRDDAIAGSQLASYLGDVARTSRVLLQDASTRPSLVASEGIRSLRVEVRGESDLAGIVTFLQNLEGGQKLVRVDRIDISRVPGLEERNGYETLSLAATITGFAYAPQASDTAAIRRPERGGSGR